MAENIGKVVHQDLAEVHKHYMDIINCMPNAVYWVDLDCNLQGFNENFVHLLGIDKIEDLSGRPYDLLLKYASWPNDRVENIKLDDMGVIFSGKAKYNIEEPTIMLGNGKELNYAITRVPLFDGNKKVSGLVVILIDAAKSIQTRQNNEKKLQQDLNSLDKHNGSIPKVLMVEDNLIAQKVEKNLMINLGCEVDVADSGEEALVLFEPGKYDIVFMDIGLQDTSGYIVAKKLREKEAGTDDHVPIIALTSYKAEVVKHDCRDYFMAGAITKPLTSDQVEQIIQRYVYNQDIVVKGLVST